MGCFASIKTRWFVCLKTKTSRNVLKYHLNSVGKSKSKTYYTSHILVEMAAQSHKCDRLRGLREQTFGSYLSTPHRSRSNLRSQQTPPSSSPKRLPPTSTTTASTLRPRKTSSTSSLYSAGTTVSKLSSSTAEFWIGKWSRRRRTVIRRQRWRWRRAG